MTSEAKFDPDYFSFDENFPYAVQIIKDSDNKKEIEVFPTKEMALSYENSYNKGLIGY